MIVTFKPIVINRRKDGTWPVKIRVTFKGVSRRLPTTLSATIADLTRGGRIKSADLLNKAEAIVRQMREAAAKISPFESPSRSGCGAGFPLSEVSLFNGGAD